MCCWSQYKLYINDPFEKKNNYIATEYTGFKFNAIMLLYP